MTVNISLHTIDVGMDIAIAPHMRTADIHWDWDAALAAVGDLRKLLHAGVGVPYLQKGIGGHVFIEAADVGELIYFLRVAGYRAVLQGEK